jgi:hypothetical protein
MRRRYLTSRWPRSTFSTKKHSTNRGLCSTSLVVDAAGVGAVGAVVADAVDAALSGAVVAPGAVAAAVADAAEDGLGAEAGAKRERPRPEAAEKRLG